MARLRSRVQLGGEVVGALRFDIRTASPQIKEFTRLRAVSWQKESSVKLTLIYKWYQAGYEMIQQICVPVVAAHSFWTKSS
jgi:hypothetical protein